MPLRNYARRRLVPRLVFALSLAALPLLLGSAIIYWQTLRGLSAEARTATHEAVRLFDLMLGNAEGAARVALSHRGQTCADVTLVLREQVAVVPFVRSVNLTHGDDIYCTSLFGESKASLERSLYVNGRLRLMAGNPITPDVGLLILRREEGEYGALATVDGRYLSSTLQLVDQRSDLQLLVGGEWMDEEGNVSQGEPVPLPVGHVRIDSERFPYSVVGGFAEGSQWRHIREEALPLASLLIALGLISGVACYWLWGRSATPSLELERALMAGEFVPYLQPLVDARDGHWTGAEVLMRWKHPREGMVGPDLFIPLAERSGLIVPMTRDLMHRVGEGLAPYGELLGEGFHLGINISAVHCSDPSLFDDCLSLQARFLPHRPVLVLELTERELLAASEATDRLFSRLDAQGIRLAIDDFGTGNSSLAYLHRFKVDALKIDKSFVTMIGVDALSRHILDSIVELCGKLDLMIIAEGVETEEQWRYLAERGVGVLQGYLFGKPMPMEDFLLAMRERNGGAH
ncbi:cyclic diguanylate phosphodiesterase [Pseudomonas sp. ZM23]|uniref:cyclic-guanylate-specific phosphodiesterase n=1 Tax=Pseudomonas triclosanedens TaxID=2961893 RepID=A0ABY6ZUN3_9PSED|nr:cyclic diguanylate phosphodiesterase [Pseudomonas triclosanedens]MCP8463368.1 cyclic diguanylate phosphodiesterase [Pseudomonas triclosanedens]MCP8469573.1 cyclic diguanylate phosphodiesterase [Pseudomonas triclosanedens]MCP8474169.1 cyclic diguanylate phosphodiesterase [Pseudomonas triclosanedens]WAI48440.1 cyclic diguanylate phosphodiesterase [Pseudomonas triclosanedens]